MHQAFSAVATLLFIGVAGFVGLRLIWISRTTRGFPEFVFGTGLTLIVLYGYPLLIAGRLSTESAPETARWLLAMAALPMAVGWSAVWVFTWWVFRPDAAWAKAVAFSAVAITLAFGVAGTRTSLAWQSGPIDYGQLAYSGPGLMAMFSYLWGAFEAFAYYDRMRKRAAIGLADAVLANRFLLWGLVMIFAASSTAIPTFATWAGIDSIRSAPILTSSAVAGIGCSLCLWLAFLPPAAYVRYVRGAHAESPA